MNTDKEKNKERNHYEKELNKTEKLLEKINDYIDKQEQTQQEYSDIKVSKETAKVLKALIDWGTLLNSVTDLGLQEDELEHDYIEPLYKVRDCLDNLLFHAVWGLTENGNVL